MEHAALKTLMTSPGVGWTSPWIARWASRLMAYDFTVEYFKGRPIQLSVCQDCRGVKTPKKKMML